MSTPRHPGGTLRLPLGPRPDCLHRQLPGPGPRPRRRVPLPCPTRPRLPRASRRTCNVSGSSSGQRCSGATSRRGTSWRCCACWPALFTTPVPLATGIARAIRAELGYVEVPTAGLGRALHYWTNAPGYLAAVAAGEKRRNLDGTEAGVPDEAQRQFATEIMEQRAARQALRTASRPPHRSHPRRHPEAVPPAAPEVSHKSRT